MKIKTPEIKKILECGPNFYDLENGRWVIVLKQFELIDAGA